MRQTVQLQSVQPEHGKQRKLRCGVWTIKLQRVQPDHAQQAAQPCIRAADGWLARTST
jgi:hypothetical protein